LKTSPFLAASGSLNGFVAFMVENGGAKVKGSAYVALVTGEIRLAALHWYEAHGIGKRDIKIKRYLDRES